MGQQHTCLQHHAWLASLACLQMPAFAANVLCHPPCMKSILTDSTELRRFHPIPIQKSHVWACNSRMVSWTQSKLQPYLIAVRSASSFPTSALQIFDPMLSLEGASRPYSCGMTVSLNFLAVVYSSCTHIIARAWFFEVLDEVSVKG